MSKASPVAPTNVRSTDHDAAVEREKPAPHVSKLPDGVTMHDGRVSHPYATKPMPEERTPKDPPRGWKGGFARCGKCDDFLGISDRCTTCAYEIVAAPCNMVAR